MVQRTHKQDSSTSIFHHGWIFLINLCEFLKEAKGPGSNKYDDQAKDDGESYVQILTHTTWNTVNGGGTGLKNIFNYFISKIHRGGTLYLLLKYSGQTRYKGNGNQVFFLGSIHNFLPLTKSKNHAIDNTRVFYRSVFNQSILIH